MRIRIWKNKRQFNLLLEELTTSRVMIPLGKSFPLGSAKEPPAQHPPALTPPGLTAELLSYHLSRAYK